MTKTNVKHRMTENLKAAFLPQIEIQLFSKQFCLVALVTYILIKEFHVKTKGERLYGCTVREKTISLPRPVFSPFIDCLCNRW